MSSKDLTNQKFGLLTVLERDFDDPRNKTQKSSFWKCQCKCGNIKTISYSNLKQGQTKSCGCLIYQTRTVEVEDLSGQRFGKIIVLERDYNYRQEKGLKHKGSYWKCQCDCGNVFTTARERLVRGIQSCGCILSKGEQYITAYLNSRKVKYKAQYCLSGFKFASGGIPRFDYALLDSHDEVICLIEYHGKQHYQYGDSFWDTKENYDKRIIRDNNKKEYCQNNHIPLEIISYTQYNQLGVILNEILLKYKIK